MSKLLIVESPTKARTIGKMLGKDYDIFASMGHIRDLPERDLGVDIANHFAPQYVDTARSKSVVKELKSAAKKADEISAAFEKSGRFTILGKTSDGEEGVGLILKTEAEYAVVDLILSGLDGLGVLDRLSAYGSKTKIIVYTSLSSEEVVETCISKGAAFYVAKQSRKFTERNAYCENDVVRRENQ